MRPVPFTPPILALALLASGIAPVAAAGAIATADTLATPSWTWDQPPAPELEAPPDDDGGDRDVVEVEPEWHASYWVRIGALAGLYGVGWLLDDEVDDWIRDNQSDLNTTLADIGDVMGRPAFTAPTALGTLGLGYLTGSRWLRDTGWMWTEVLLVVGAVQQPARIIAGRARPEAELGNSHFEMFSTSSRSGSFISGHAASSVGMMRILSRQVDNIYAAVGLHALGLVTPLSRLYDRKHWFSDIIMGSALGWFAADVVMGWHEELDEPEAAARAAGPELRLVPWGMGLALSGRF